MRIEEDVAVGTEAALCQPNAQRALAPARRQRQTEGEGSGQGAGPGATSGPGSEVGWGKGTPEIWGRGPGASWVSSWLPTRSSRPAWEARCPHHALPVSWAHLESQDSGCTGPQDLYTLADGQVRSGGTQTGVRQAEEARAPSGHARLTAQPVSGIAPVRADAPGAAEFCVGLQALAEHLAATAGPAAVTDTGVEVRARWDEAVAPGEDPAGRAHQRLQRRPLRVMAPHHHHPTQVENSRAQHQLAEGLWGARRVDGGRAGFRQEGAGGWGQAGGHPAALHAAVGDQPGPGHVPAGAGRGAVWLATFIPAVVGAGAWGGRGSGGHTGPSSPSPFVSQPPQQLLSYQRGPPAWGRCRGRLCVWGPRGGCARCGGAGPSPPLQASCSPAHRTGPRCCD